jgi:hypothetical protein
VVVAADPWSAIQTTSRDAALVFLGFEAPEEGSEAGFYDRMERWAGALRRVVYVDSMGEMSLES